MKTDNLIMNISKFLSIYYNLEGEVLKQLTHEQIQDMLDLKPVNYEDITIEDLLKGNVLLVKDSEREVIGYSNPYLDIKDSENDDPYSVMISFDKNPDVVIDNINDYSRYELTELIKECKKAKDDKSKHTVIKELNRRDGREKHSKERKLEKVRKRETRKEW